MRMLLYVLALVAAPACADWVPLGEANAVSHFFDPDTIREDGYFRRVWTLQEQKQPHESGKVSSRVLFELDCQKERFRLLSSFDYSKSMAGGEILRAIGYPSNWTYIPPQTPAALTFEIVCSK